MGNSTVRTQSSLPVRRSKQYRFRFLPVSSAQVMKTRRLGRTMIYQLIDKEGLPVLHFGRAVRISYASLQEWIKQREAQV